MNSIEDVRAVDLDDESIAQWREVHKAAIHTKTPSVNMNALHRNSFIYNLLTPDQRRMICKKCYRGENEKRS